MTLKDHNLWVGPVSFLGGYFSLPLFKTPADIESGEMGWAEWFGTGLIIATLYCVLLYGVVALAIKMRNRTKDTTGN